MTSTMHQEGRNHIGTMLELNEVKVDTYQSKSLYVPRMIKAKGVFGGQMMAQAIVAATNTVDPAFGLHVGTWNS